MVVTDTQLLNYFQWLLVGNDEQFGALWWFLLVGVALSVVSLILGFIFAAVRHGPMAAGDMTYRVVTTGLREMFFVSPRRVWALARLAVQESFRRRVWVAFLVFIAILLFAGWFMDEESREPVKLYLSFVLSASMFLVLIVSLFLSVFSLPNDIKNRTIYTVVTKPVQPGEIVLGRILGFTIVGSVLLLLMGVTSYFFVVRGLSHTHEIKAEQLAEVSGEDGPIGREGETSRALNHRHGVIIDKEGAVTLKSNLGHTHEVTTEKDSRGETVYHVSGPRGLFRARVPVYGKIRFRDRTGKDAARGISVGNEWTYRSFIEGGSLSAAIWTFEGVNAKDYPDGLPLELNIRVFRSYKGNIEEGILGSLVIKNPDTGRMSDIHTFRAKDFYIDSQSIPRKLTDSNGKEIDLFDLVTPDGRVEVWLQCLNRAQYFGAAQADCYLRAKENVFELNFIKGYLGIWAQMILVICFGVLLSTFLSGPVALIAAIGAIVLGFFSDFVIKLTQGTIQGGGPIESLVRIPTQMNLTVELEKGIGVSIIQTIDQVLLFFMSAAARLLPNYSQYSNTDWVADGFDIPQGVVLQNLTACLAYLFAVFIAGYFFLRLREVAK